MRQKKGILAACIVAALALAITIAGTATAAPGASKCREEVQEEALRQEEVQEEEGGCSAVAGHPRDADLVERRRR